VLWCTGREDLTKQCQLDRDADNIAVDRPVVITDEKNNADLKSSQKDDADGMNNLDEEVSVLFLTGSLIPSLHNTTASII